MNLQEGFDQLVIFARAHRAETTISYWPEGDFWLVCISKLEGRDGEGSTPPSGPLRVGRDVSLATAIERALAAAAEAEWSR